MCNYHLLRRYVSSKKCNCILTKREALLKKKNPSSRDSLCCLNGSFTSGTTDFVKSINSLSDKKNQWRNANFRKKSIRKKKHAFLPIGIIVKSIYAYVLAQRFEIRTRISKICKAPMCVCKYRIWYRTYVLLSPWGFYVVRYGFEILHRISRTC